MLAKKESFLKYLRDDDIPNIKPTKTFEKKENDSKNNDNDNNNNKINEKLLINDSNLKNIDCSFQNFVNEIKNFDYDKKIKWDSDIHKTSLLSDKNTYKIKLMELTRIDYTNPLLILHKDYLKLNYQPSLFNQEITHIEDKIKITQINNKSNKTNTKNNLIIESPQLFVENLIEEREKYELNKKILKYYLLYYCENNYEKYAPSAQKIEKLTNDVNFFYDRIHSGRNKLKILKKCNIDNTMKLILKRKKYENLSKLYFFLKNNILSCYKDIKKLKLKSMNYDYINYYKENNKIIDQINTMEKNIDQIFNVKKGENLKKLTIIEEIKKKLMKKKEKFTYKYTSEINNLFDSKKSNIMELFHLFNIDNTIQLNKSDKNETDNIESNNIINNQTNMFVSKMTKNFKLKSKKLILETVYFFRKKEKTRSNSITMMNLNSQKLSNINNVNIDENDLIVCFKTILLKLKNLSEIFIYYYDLICSNKTNNASYESLKKEIKLRKNDFYDILDKHLSKLIKLFYNTRDKKSEEKIISKKNFLIVLNIICLFEKLLQFKFEVNYSKYLNLALKNYIVNQIKFENRNILTRAISLLPNDIWDKAFLDPSFFQINSIKEKTPFYLKKFIVFLNEDEIEEDNPILKEVNKNNIEDIFNYINNNDNYNYNYGFNNNNSNNDNVNSGNDNINNINFEDVVDLYNKKKGIRLINKKNDTIILNKQLKYNSLYVTNSSCCILKGVEEQIINFIMFGYLTYEIYTYLFNNIDLYIFICFKIFMTDNQYMSSLLKPLNIKEIQKDIENIAYWSEVTSYQQKYSELKKFYISSEKKFCDFYGHSKKFDTVEEKQNFIDNLIPKLNQEILFINESEIKNQQINNGNNENGGSNNKINFKIFNFKKNKNNNNEMNNNNEDDIETLNINQMNDDARKINAEKEKEKNKDTSFFGMLKSAVDDIGDGLTKAKDSAKNLLKDTKIQEQNLALIKEIKEKISSTHIKQIIILVSCISTLHKTLKRLIGFSSKIELDFQRNQIIEKLNKYKKLKEQIQYFFYMRISLTFMDFSKISPLIEEFNWAPSPEEGSTQLFEPSSWVKKIIKLFETIVNEIIIQFNELFGDKKLIQYFVILIKFIISNIQENIAKIKKCNDTGRSIMLKDIKFLKQGIENILSKYNYTKKIKTDELFDIIFQYINSWYYSCDELIKFIFDNNIQYKYFNSFLNTSPVINELSTEARNDFVKKVNQKYLIQFKKIIVELKD